MGKLRSLALIAVSSMFLPGIVFVYISLSLVHLNVEEIRSLPNTYLWLIRSFLVFWIMNAVVVAAALRGRLTWLARLSIGIGACIFIFDGFRSLWLSTPLTVTIVALAEIALVGVTAAIIRRIEFRRLLRYSAFCAGAIIVTMTAVHVRAMGAHLIFNVFKEIIRPAADHTRTHPSPWWQNLSSEERRNRTVIDLGGIVPVREDVEIRSGDSVWIANAGPPEADVATLRVELPRSAAAAYVELQIRLAEGDVSVGIRHPVTGQWFYRRHALLEDGERQVLTIPVYQHAEHVDLVFSNGRVGQQSFGFQIDSAGVYEVAAALGGDTVFSQGNVYEILLDGFELAAYRKIMETRSEVLHDGFTLYERFRTSQPRTAWSLPTIVSSTYYDPQTGENADVWREQSYQRGLFFDLTRPGVPVYEYPWTSQHCFEDAEYCFSSQDYRSELLSQVSDNFIIDLTFLRILPNSLRAILIGSIDRDRPSANSWDYGFSLTSAVGKKTFQTSETDMLKEFYFSLNLFTPGLFQTMLVEEVERPDKGQFVFFHSLIPHDPQARDENCDFIPKKDRAPDGKVDGANDQSICALRMVGWLIQQLKTLGRYDDALIVVHSDHGAVRRPPGVDTFRFDQASTSEWPHWAVESASAGLLMIKWPGASGMSISQAPAQTIDIAPTILHHFGVAIPQHYQGTPLQTMPEDMDRQMVFYAVKKPLIGESAKQISKYVRGDDGQWIFETNISTDP